MKFQPMLLAPHAYLCLHARHWWGQCMPLRCWDGTVPAFNREYWQPWCGGAGK